METGHESQTAIIVCTGRALAHGATPVGRFTDPTALHLLPPAARARVERFRAGTAPTRVSERLKRAHLAGLSKMMVARTVESTTPSGHGRRRRWSSSGPDSTGERGACRAARRDVFEVDHPDSQRDKRSRVGAAQRPSRRPLRAGRLRTRRAGRGARESRPRSVEADDVDLGRRGDVPRAPGHRGDASA